MGCGCGKKKVSFSKRLNTHKKIATMTQTAKDAEIVSNPPISSRIARILKRKKRIARRNERIARRNAKKRKSRKD